MTRNRKSSLKIEDLQRILEPLIRRIVREELDRIVQQEPGLFVINPDMPLYADMRDLSQRKSQGNIKLFTHKEVWGE